jgi:hypothetical protein
MSCYYKALPKFIPELILSAGYGREIAIVSPWIVNVTLLPPRFGDNSTSYTSSKISFNEFLVRVVRDFDMRIVFLIRPNDRRTYYALNAIVSAVPENVIIREFEHIHAKMVVTPYFALETTANMIPTSLFRNIESCTLVRNSFNDTRRYLNHKLGDHTI